MPLKDLLDEDGTGLTISRGRDEEIIIYHRKRPSRVIAVIKIMDTRPDKVRVKIRALDGTGVDRREIYNSKHPNVTDRNEDSINGRKPTSKRLKNGE
jgi:sRNA-binding carbon storage regulator CsrA